MAQCGSGTIGVVYFGQTEAARHIFQFIHDNRNRKPDLIGLKFILSDAVDDSGVFENLKGIGKLPVVSLYYIAFYSN